jgi:iron complex outermembrane receptor protein
VALRGQTPVDQPAQRQDTKSNEEIVRLSAFIVETSEDIGYLSKNSLAGTKTAERLFNIPQSIQIINGDLLSDLNQTYGFEAIKYGTSGVVRRSNRTDDAFVRGFRTNVFYRDGITYTGGTSTINSQLYDVDRIEVIKGPAALLFGQSASVGGVINYVTKRPTKKLTADIKATVGTNDFYKFETTVSGPAMNKSVRYRITLGKQDYKQDRRFGHYHDYFIGGSLDWDVSSNTIVTLDANYSRIDSFPDYTFVDNTGAVASRPKDFSVNEAWCGFINYTYWFNLSINTKISPTLEMRVSGWYKYDSRDGIQSRGQTLSADSVTLTRLAQDVLQVGEPKGLQLDILKTINYKGSESKVSFGVEARRGSQRARTFYMALASLNTLNPVYGATPTPTTAAIANLSMTDSSDLQTAAYVQDQTSFLKGKILVMAGARANVFDNNNLTITSLTTNNTIVNFYDKANVGRFGLVAKPIRELALYYNKSESFLFNTGIDYYGNLFRPSIGKVDEYGVKLENLKGTMFASAAYFNNRQTNVRTFFTIPPSLQQNSIQGAQETTKGYEIDMGLSKEISFGMLNLTAHYYSGNSKDAQGARTVNVPKNTLSGFAKFELTSGIAKGLGIGFGAYHVSDRLGTASYVYPPYTVAIANLSYHARNWRVALSVDNVFDKIYADGSEGRLWLFTGERRGFKVTADYRF